jgi:hypothetical protein
LIADVDFKLKGWDREVRGGQPTKFLGRLAVQDDQYATDAELQSRWKILLKKQEAGDKRIIQQLDKEFPRGYHVVYDIRVSGDSYIKEMQVFERLAIQDDALVSAGKDWSPFFAVPYASSGADPPHYGRMRLHGRPVQMIRNPRGHAQRIRPCEVVLDPVHGALFFTYFPAPLETARRLADPCKFCLILEYLGPLPGKTGQHKINHGKLFYGRVEVIRRAIVYRESDGAVAFDADFTNEKLAPYVLKWWVSDYTPPPAIQFRTFRDATGGFSVEAAFLEIKDGKVHLRRKDNGKVITVSMNVLDKKDQNWIQSEIVRRRGN